jgi:cytoskeletal protein CcmA (bactofilin family)
MADQVTPPSSLIIGEGVVFTGSIHAPGTASINGTVNGEVMVADLQIGPKGNVAGKIEAKVIDVHGILSDKIVCHEHIMIHRSGSVSGQLDYADIEIERGGQFKGTMIQHNQNSIKVGDAVVSKK